jgi:hypothetical protein
MAVLVWAAPLAVTLTKEERLLLWVSVLVGVLLVGAWIIARVDRWRKRQMEDADDSPDQMMSFRALYERGELSKEEYDRVLRRVADRAGAKPKPVPTAAAESPPAAEPPATQEPPPPLA